MGLIRWRNAGLVKPWVQGAGVSLLVGVLLGCTPTYNWRELRVQGTPLQALLPCKPDQAERQVPLAGVATSLHMQSCETGGITYALAWAQLSDATQTAAALSAWREASLRAVRAEASAPALEAQALPTPGVKGAEATLWTAVVGTNHMGQPLQTRALYFSLGHQIFQAAVYGERLPEPAVAPFFDALRLP